MPTNLKNLRLEEVSLVDVPANQHAHVSIFKRDVAGPSGVSHGGKGVLHMTPEELQKQLSDLEGKVTQLTKERDEALEKAAKADEVEKEYVEVNGEKVEKSLVPSPILKQLETQAEAIAKMQAERELDAMIKRASTELGNLPGDTVVKAQIMKAVADIDGALDLLKSADGVAATAMTETGAATGDDSNDVEAKLETMAAEYAKEKGVTKAAAYFEITKSGEGLELYKQRNAK